MRLLNKSLTESVFDSLKDIAKENEEFESEDTEQESENVNESVMVNTGSTTITSDETGVTIEDNGNTITTGNGVTVDVDNTNDILPAEMDIPTEGPIDEPVDDVVADVPTEDIENVEPIEELPEEPLEDEEEEEKVEESLKEGAYKDAIVRALDRGDLDEEILVQNYNDYGYDATSAYDVLSRMNDSEAKQFLDDCGWSDLYRGIHDEDDEDLDESTVNEEVLETKDEETEEEINNSKTDPVIKLSNSYKEIDVPKGHIVAGPSLAREINSKKEDKEVIEEADGYNQNQNVEIYQNPEFDYQILDITELDNVDSGDIRAVDMANILNDLDESLTEAYGDANYVGLNSFLTRKGTHKKTNESYSSAILELSLPKLSKSVGNYKNTFFLEVYGDKKLKECIVRDSSNHIIKEYSGRSTNPVEHFKNVILDIDRSRQLTEEVNDAAYEVAEKVEKQFEGEDLIIWEDFRDAVYAYVQDLNLGLSDDEIWDFEQDVRGVMSLDGWATIYEGTYEGGLTTKDPNIFESVEVMVNEPMKDKGVNFADSKAIDKDEKRQANHLKQHANKNKENKKFKIEKEPDQENTTGKTEEEITDTVKVSKLPKAKKTKVDAKKLKVKEIKESKELNEMGNFAGRMDTLRAAGDRAALYRKDVSDQKNRKIEELFSRLKEIQDDVEELKEIGKHVKLYDLKDRYGIWLDASGRGLDYEDPDDSDNTLFVDTYKIQMRDGNIAAGEITAEELTKPNPFHHKNVFIKLATEMLDNYPGYIKAVNQMIDDYDLKYPKQSIDESVKKIKESTKLDESLPVVEKHKDGSVYVKDQYDEEYNYKSIDEAISDYEDKLEGFASEEDEENENLAQNILDELYNLNESVKLKEADELLDDPEVTDGSDMRDGREELEESGSDVAIFHRKPQSVSAMRAAEQNGITVNKSNYKIIGKKELSGEEFEKFANDLSSESYDWLKEYNDTTNSGEFKCVEVVNTDDDSYSLLVDPQGYNYARYAAIKDNLGNEEELIEPEEELIEPEEELVNEE